MAPLDPRYTLVEFNSMSVQVCVPSVTQRVYSRLFFTVAEKLKAKKLSYKKNSSTSPARNSRYQRIFPKAWQKTQFQQKKFRAKLYQEPTKRSVLKP